MTTDVTSGQTGMKHKGAKAQRRKEHRHQATLFAGFIAPLRLWALVFHIRFVLLLFTPAMVSAQEPASTENAAETSAMAPVVVDGITLFSVRGVSAFPAEKRAGEIADRIVAVAENRSIASNALRLDDGPVATHIIAGNQSIMTVVDADARAQGVDRHVLARVFQMRIAEAINNYRQDRTPAFLGRHSLYTLAATVVLLAGLLAGRRIRRRVHETLERRYRPRIRGVHIQSFHILRTEQIWRILVHLENLFWTVALLVACYVYLDFVLYLFPWTRGLANNLGFFILRPLQTMGSGLLRIIPDLVFILILFAVTRYLLILIRLFFSAVESGTIKLREFDPEWAKPTYRLVRVTVIAFALVVAYPYIPGSDSQAFKGVSLFIGVLVSLGSTSLIGNIIAGYSLTYRRTFKAGDRVRIGDHTGIVEQSRVMATYLRTFKNEVVVVPNSKIVNEEVINYSTMAQDRGLILHTTVGVGYDMPWRQVEAMLMEAAARTKGLMREPKPFVLQKALGQFSVTYEINGYCNQSIEMGVIYSRLHRNILDLFNEYGVQITTPAYESDPERVKVVPRDQWYAPPARDPGTSSTDGPTDGLVA
jgi:small-conductance mechanosensitive channel